MTEKRRTRSADELAALERASDWTISEWHTLGVIEDPQHGLLLPSAIRTRSAAGTVKEEPIVLMLLDGPRVVQARVRARRWAEESGLDPRRTADGPDADFVRELEQFEELAYAIREPEAPHDQKWRSGRELWAAVRVRGTMHEVYAIFDQWTLLNDPRYGELTGEQMWEVLARVSREGNLLPLMRTAGRGQAACILLAAREALRSPSAPSGFASRPTSSSLAEAPAT